MKQYRVTTYLTLTGRYDFVDLGDSTYGEWIICENNEPKFHVNLFNVESESDRRLKEIIVNSGEDIEASIQQISRDNNKNLKLQERHLFEIVLKSEMKKLDLKPLPIEWIKRV